MLVLFGLEFGAVAITILVLIGLAILITSLAIQVRRASVGIVAAVVWAIAGVLWGIGFAAGRSTTPIDQSGSLLALLTLLCRILALATPVLMAVIWVLYVGLKPPF